MDKAKLVEQIKKGDLRPKGRPGAMQAKIAIQQLQLLGTITDLDPKTAYSARRELTAVVAEYRRTLRVKRKGRRKMTRG